MPWPSERRLILGSTASVRFRPVADTWAAASSALIDGSGGKGVVGNVDPSKVLSLGVDDLRLLPVLAPAGVVSEMDRGDRPGAALCIGHRHIRTHFPANTARCLG